MIPAAPHQLHAVAVTCEDETEEGPCKGPLLTICIMLYGTVLATRSSLFGGQTLLHYCLCLLS